VIGDERMSVGYFLRVQVTGCRPLLLKSRGLDVDPLFATLYKEAISCAKVRDKAMVEELESVLGDRLGSISINYRK
jgi:hypothetical protein